MAEILYTYKTLEQEKVDIYWTINNKSILKNKTHYLEAWQKNTDISIKTEIFIIPDTLQECIRPDIKASFIIQWHSLLEKDGTGLQGKLAAIQISPEENFIFLEGILAGTEIAGTVELIITLCITEEDKSNQSSDNRILYANEKGAVLFTSKQYLVIEGEQSFFPVADIDFRKKNYPEKALFFLHRKYSSLESSFTTAYKLYFNNRHPLYRKINNLNDEAGKNFLVNMIMYDVYKQLAMQAIEDLNFHFEENTDFESHSVRTVFTSILKNAFPGLSLDILRDMVNDPEKKNTFFCGLQADLLTYGE